MNRIIRYLFLLVWLPLLGCQYLSASFEAAASLDASGKSSEAITAYENYLKLHSSGPLAAQATYRIAKNYVAQTDYSNAILWFEKVLSDHKNTDQETLALLDLAALYREGLKDSSKSMEFSQRAFLKYLGQTQARAAAEELVEAQYRTAASFYEKGEYKKAADTAAGIFQAYPSAFVSVQTKALVDNLADRAHRADLLGRSSVDLVFLRKEEPFAKAFELDFPPVPGLTDRLPSPDGKYRVERKLSPSGVYHLYLAQVPEKGDRLLFKALKPTFGAGLPSWSPDSKDLIYVRNAGGKRKLERTDIRTKSTQTLFWTDGKDLGSVVSYHPSGNMIAYLYAGQVWIMNPNGIKRWLKNKEKLSYTAGLIWSKDGTMIRYWDPKHGPKDRVDGVLILDASMIPPLP